jgi:predicted nucleotidyltransferase
MDTGRSADPLSTALFPESRRAILGLLYAHPDESFYLRQIVDLAGLAVGQTQRELKRLTESGILERSERGRHVYFRANERCPIYDELKGIVAKTTAGGAAIARGLAPLVDRIKVAFLFGSVARGEETRGSDIDVMVVGSASFAEVAGAVRAVEQQLRREINIVVYPVGEFTARVQQGHSFLARVIEDEKTFIVGSQYELDALLAERVDT